MVIMIHIYIYICIYTCIYIYIYIYAYFVFVLLTRQVFHSGCGCSGGEGTPPETLKSLTPNPYS